MSEKKVAKPVALAVGAAIAGSFALTSGIASADTAESPFALSTMQSGYMLGTGEGNCGGDKEGKEGEGSCGEGSCGGDKESEGKDGEGSCGEGSCGGDKDDEGSCGGDKEDSEGACGEGSCGGSV